MPGKPTIKNYEKIEKNFSTFIKHCIAIHHNITIKKEYALLLRNTRT